MIKASHNSVRILFAGGGTGGHLYPAIAIAERLTQLWSGDRPLEIAFVGTKRGLEFRLRDKLGFPLYLINVRGLARQMTLKNLLVPFILIGALFKSAKLLNNFAPNLVVGTGGYVALPILKMAGVKKITTVLQEQNSFPGITTRRSAYNAKKIYLGFEGAKERITTTGEMIVTGNPVRHTLRDGNREAALAKYKLNPNKKTLLVIGGSQGARGINEAIVRSLKENQLGEQFQLLWQTGRGAYKEVSSSLGGRVDRHALFPFADDMAEIYAAADLAIARAGALTLAELEVVGLPSILIPFPQAAGDHQRKNAVEFSKNGFAEVIDEYNLPQMDLLKRAVELIESEKFEQMKNDLVEKTKEKKAAVDIIAEDIIELLKIELAGEKS